MLDNLYVDDLYYGAKTANDAFELTSKAVEILNTAGFNLRKLKTNCEELRELWHKNGYGENTDFAEGTGFLGLKWDSTEDKIKLDLKDVKDSLGLPITKRHVLRIISKIFDPCGIISPFVIRAKILMQELWERGLKWDEQLPDDLIKKWKSWCLELPELENIEIERKLFSCLEISEVSLHVFVDASPKAYGAVCYFRYVTKNGNIKVSFILSKSKVAPLKTLTLARLELMAALIGARIGKYLQNVFPKLTKQIFFWSDSKIVLHWLKNTAKMWKPFVANRVAQVQSLSQPECWNHCSGLENPADFTTRGESAKKILSSSLWKYGPDWLSGPVEFWPLNSSTTEDINKKLIEDELKKVAINVILSKNNKSSISTVIEIDRYSSLSKLLRVTAWIQRFLHNSKLRSQKISGQLSALELKTALDIWLIDIQNRHFGTEIEQLSSRGAVEKSSDLYNLNCYIDNNNFLCLQGRLASSNLNENEKHPILLPSNNKFVELLILDAHKRVGHLGVDSTLTELRERYWIIKGRNFIKKILKKKCLVCKRYAAKAGAQVVAPLPAERIQESPPFSVSGVDLAGPFYIKDSTNKCYLLIFTCAVTRAIHLEVVLDMSTNSFLLGFRRFISRRGLCSTLFSDNAKAFKMANKELKKLWDKINDTEVKNMFASKGITWHFIVEKSPWWGGFWERQIRTVKTCLKKIIGKSSLSLKELETVFLEIEAIINSRPITYIYNEPSEPSPLTPAHFLIGKRLTALPIIKYNIADLSTNRSSLTKQFKYQQTLLNHFWNRWRKEYLLNLRSAYFSPPPDKITSLKVNDVVLLNDTKYPRNIWMLGRILELYPGRDGKIRSLLLRTPKGDLKRSIQLVHKLELDS